MHAGATLAGHTRVELFVWLTVFVLLSFYVGHSLRFVYPHPASRVLLSPGLFLANVARMCACQVTFTPRTQTRLFERDGVRYEKTPVPVLAPALIATTTLVVPFLALLGVNSALDTPLVLKAGLPTLDLNVHGFRSFLGVIVGLDDHALAVYDEFENAISRLGGADPSPWVVLYLAVAILLGSAPTRADLRHVLLAVLVLVVGNRLAETLIVGGPLLSTEWFEAAAGRKEVWHLFTFCVRVLFGLFLIVILLDIGKKVREMALEPEPPTPAPHAAQKKPAPSR